MKRVSVKSGNIASIGYDEESKDLEVEFKVTGGIYVYSNVPKRTHTNLMKADSIGGFFARFIKNSYVWKKV